MLKAKSNRWLNTTSIAALAVVAAACGSSKSPAPNNGNNNVNNNGNEMDSGSSAAADGPCMAISDVMVGGQPLEAATCTITATGESGYRQCTGGVAGGDCKTQADLVGGGSLPVGQCITAMGLPFSVAACEGGQTFQKCDSSTPPMPAGECLTQQELIASLVGDGGLGNIFGDGGIPSFGDGGVGGACPTTLTCSVPTTPLGPIGSTKLCTAAGAFGSLPPEDKGCSKAGDTCTGMGLMGACFQIPVLNTWTCAQPCQ